MSRIRAFLRKLTTAETIGLYLMGIGLAWVGIIEGLDYAANRRESAYRAQLLKDAIARYETGVAKMDSVLDILRVHAALDGDPR